MATINQKQELNECFICIWREERSVGHKINLQQGQKDNLKGNTQFQLFA